ncbi:TSUP family transporter [Herbaspirillum sp. RTI4]|uniref:sulfite exporter TauE/SafE family protein n=1 Tax=Herbaspirillum sp. RTI4 TaxID=3048640 RepID=UPI002AB3DE47|nr:TSUP family transporter [Herbaspirillum sp. RTI4]MDY7577246.1 TSUP family transporter [Herbaspirillum sp. RTI4]MEA9980536.1 TSUP family transporter [Herbaspirillum sp. RTI4]
MLDYFILCIAAFVAGLIDAVVGGGGLVLVPTLFSVFPNTAPATLLGTNKVASIMGTTASAVNYARTVRIRWSTAAPAAIAALLLSFLGAFTVTHIPTGLIRQSLPFVLVAVGAYTFMKKDFGQHHVPLLSGSKEKWMAVLVGAWAGFYDGVFGPGTGSFLVFAFVRLFGFDFLRASAVSKVVNIATNLAALTWLGYTGHVIWQLGILMAAFNIAGSLFGTKLAIRHGSGFVRRLFLVVISALVLKTGYDAFFR